MRKLRLWWFLNVFFVLWNSVNLWHNVWELDFLFSALATVGLVSALYGVSQMSQAMESR